jgi:hypothetical protein
MVRDDAELTGYCVGESCVAAKKKGGNQVEFLQVKMSDLVVSDVARIHGRPITTSQGIIAILIGQMAPPGAAPASIPETGLQKVKSPPAAGLLDDRSPSAASPTSGRAGTRVKSLRPDAAPATGGASPMVK